MKKQDRKWYIIIAIIAVLLFGSMFFPRTQEPLEAAAPTDEPYVPIETPAPTPKPTPTPKPVNTPEPLPEKTPEELAEEARRQEILYDYYDNFELLERLCIAEAGNQGYEGMWRVAYVIYCRAYETNYNFGDGIYEVMTAPSQFTTPYKGDISYWKEDVDKAINDVFALQIFPFDVPTHYFLVPSMVSESTLKWFRNRTYVDVYGVHEFRSNYSAAELEAMRNGID